jgi:hypothetical protein
MLLSVTTLAEHERGLVIVELTEMVEHERKIATTAALAPSACRADPATPDPLQRLAAEDAARTTWRLLRPSGMVLPGRHERTELSIDGGTACVPSSRWSLKVNVIQPS